MRKIRMGMVGGGEGAFIGKLHRIAAQMDGEIELVCGAFSRNPQVCKQTAEALYLDPSRAYDSYQQMFAAESLIDADKRMDMVAIVTPNHLHFPVAMMALDHGFHVMSDKPATLNLAEALSLKSRLDSSELIYGLTHTYTGYPMVKEAKERVKQGELGAIVKVVVEYPQGWLANSSDEESKQAAWRLDPNQAGVSCCMADIGVHAANLTEYVTGLEITEICADLNSTLQGRSLDDDGAVLLKFNSGTKGVLIASQVSIGEENSLRLKVYGEKASLEWQQLEPNSLWMKYAERPSEYIRAGVGTLSKLALMNMRTPAGHPEGYIEAFANLYMAFARQLRNKTANSTHSQNPRSLSSKQAVESPLTNTQVEIDDDLPGINEAVRGMAFIEGVVKASQSETKWHPLVTTASSVVVED